MDKVIEVNEKLAYAVVEPGVTFFDLYNYCVEHKLRVWPSCAALGWGSVLGNVGCSRSFPYCCRSSLADRAPVDFGSWLGFHSDREPSPTHGGPRSCTRKW